MDGDALVKEIRESIHDRQFRQPTAEEVGDEDVNYEDEEVCSCWAEQLQDEKPSKKRKKHHGKEKKKHKKKKSKNEEQDPQDEEQDPQDEEQDPQEEKAKSPDEELQKSDIVSWLAKYGKLVGRITEQPEVYFEHKFLDAMNEHIAYIREGGYYLYWDDLDEMPLLNIQK